MAHMLNAGGAGADAAFAASWPPQQQQQQLVVAGSLQQGSRAPNEDSDDDDMDRNKGPPGPLDPAACTVSGPGFQGGASGKAVSLIIYTKDTRGRRCTGGGADVEVQVIPASSSTSSSAPIVVDVLDNNNGCYTATYTAPSKGNYLVSVEIDSVPIAGSPFPVFFSAPDPVPTMWGAPAGVSVGIPGVPPPAAPSAPKAPKFLLDMPAGGGPVPAGPKGLPGMIAITSDSLTRQLYVANIAPSITADQLRQLFELTGKVVDFKVVGDAKDLAIVEFATVTEANAATSLNNMMLGDRPLRVQSPLTTQTTPGAAANPFLTLQMQQIQQMQLAQLQATQLATQVAHMRAVQRVGPVQPVVVDPLKAAEEAAERLNRKFGTVGGAPAPAPAPEAKRVSRSRSRSRSPKLKRGGSRSRSPKLKRGGSRSRSPKLRRSRSRSPRLRRRSVLGMIIIMIIIII